MICPDEDLKHYFAGKRDLQFFTISADGVKRFTWMKKCLVAEEQWSGSPRRQQPDAIARRQTIGGKEGGKRRRGFAE